MRIGIAQIRSGCGAVQRNLAQHKKLIALAVANLLPRRQLDRADAALLVIALYVPDAFGLIGFDPGTTVEKILEMLLYLLVGLLTAYIGFTLILPLVGHATWHAYRETVQDVTDTP